MAKRVSGDDSNLQVVRSDTGELGDRSFSMYELFYPIDTKDFSLGNDVRILSELAVLYEKGLSLREIAREIGCSKNGVRSSLLKGGHELRDQFSQATDKRGVSGGKQGALPFYGFCYFEGQIVRDPREFPTLQTIHNAWKKKLTIHQIANRLIQAGQLSRTGKLWSWAAVRNIVARFEQQIIVLHKGGKYEFR